MKFKGVIFDLDGTLVNSLEDLADSMNTVLQNCNFPIHELQAYNHFIGNGIRNLVRVTLPEDRRDELTIQKCYDSMVEIYRHNCINKTSVYEGIVELLDELVSRDKKLGVFSNKADELTKRIVVNLLPDYFGTVIGLSKEVLKKPNPFVALQISSDWGFLPEEMIYVGDTGTDMQTANNAGMYAVGALWGFRSGNELKANGAKHLLKHPLDLIQIL